MRIWASGRNVRAVGSKNSWIKLFALMAVCAVALVNQVLASGPTIYGSAYPMSMGASTLYNIDPNTGAATEIGSIGFNGVSSLDFSESGTLYGVGTTAGGVQELITINTTTGAGTAVGPTGVDASDHFQDIAFRHADNTLYGYEDGAIYTFNITTGVATYLGDTGDGFPSGNGLAFSPFDTLYKADYQDLWTIDQTTGAGTVAQTMTYPEAGDEVNGMKFDLATGVLYASVRRTSDGSSYLGTVDVDNGVCTEIGSTQMGLTAVGLAIAIIPEPGTFALVGMGLIGLLALRRRKS